MPRARSLKPGFFSNEDLIELPFEYRLLFAGLWTMADRAGRMEDRPKRIKLTIFPGDNVDCDAGLTSLATKKFIERYEVNGIRYIQIIAWDKHQSPHVKETVSTIPAPCKPGAATSVAALTPDSGLLTPDSGLLTADSKPLRAPVSDQIWFSRIAELRGAYPSVPGRCDWLGAERGVRRLIDDGLVIWPEVLAAVGKYALCVSVTGDRVMNPMKFFTAEDRPWSQAWELPEKSRTNGGGSTWVPDDEDEHVQA